jgi:CMP-N-acetylneuraminic acid synthetase
MKTVAFVPIKLNNERLPGKNLKQFSDGTPLVKIILNTLSKLRGEYIDEIYVYCSDAKIKAYLPENVRYLERPKYLDESKTHGKDIYREFVNTIDADIYVLAHATSPFVSVEHIRDCIEKVKNDDYDSAFCAKKLQTFLWKDNKPMNFELGNPLRTQDIEPIYMELSTPYIFKKSAFDKYQARTGIKPYICECSEIECVDIDYPDDFVLADAVYMNIVKRTAK